MKIRTSASPTAANTRTRMLNYSHNSDSISKSIARNIMQSQSRPQQPVPIAAAPVIQQFPIRNQQTVAFNFPIAAASMSQLQHAHTHAANRNISTNSQIRQFRNPTTADWKIGMQPTRAHTNMQSYVNSSMAAYLNSNAPSVILPKIPQKNTTCTTFSTSQDLLQEQKEVRTDEVEKALMSKPQRGKKRNNLNNDERKELTRSRNRLHAKTTRQRKKARYDELVDCEQKYLQFMQEKAQSDSRKNSVLKFIAFCTQVINSQQPPVSNANDAHSSLGVSTSTWGSAFGHTTPSSSGNGVLSGSIELDTQDLFAPAPLFSVTSTFGTSQEHLDLQGLKDSIHDFARDLSEMFSDDSRFNYVIPGSGDGIAMSNCDSAFSTFHIVQSTDQSLPLSSGLMQVRFVEQSHRIAMATLHTTSIENGPNSSDGEEASSPPLGGRDTFPSVVSLEKDLVNKRKSV